MRPTGRRSHTDRRRPRVEERPGRSPGRSSHAALLALFVLPLVLVLPRPAAAFELLSWWRRDLLDVSWQPGDWATYAQTEWTEDGVFTDTLTVRVLAADTPSRRWIELADRRGDRVDRVLLRPDALRAGDDPLAAVDSLLRREGDGPWVVEDVDAHRDQRLVRRHLSDPFDEPDVRRVALADTTIQGGIVPRERVVLAETRREERSLGRSTLVVTTRLQAAAVVSPLVPLAGILRARSVSTVTTTTEGEGSRRSRRAQPPLVTERRVECLAFGRGTAGTVDSERP